MICVITLPSTSVPIVLATVWVGDQIVIVANPAASGGQPLVLAVLEAVNPDLTLVYQVGEETHTGRVEVESLLLSDLGPRSMIKARDLYHPPLQSPSEDHQATPSYHFCVEFQWGELHSGAFVPAHGITGSYFNLSVVSEEECMGRMEVEFHHGQNDWKMMEEEATPSMFAPTLSTVCEKIDWHVACQRNGGKAKSTEFDIIVSISSVFS
ncbi:hypothetical protein EI94DRAFT_1697236 [Lactarius quietus]|nr:hypothetical protein EI94DRAFT_1697236 [Lactarius quietus]